MDRADVAQRAQRYLENLGDVRDFLLQDPTGAFRSTLPSTIRTRAIVFPGSNLESLTSGSTDEAVREQKQKIAKDGASALEKLIADPSGATLSLDEAMALEAVVELVGRPALVVKNGTYSSLPPGWRVLKPFHDSFPRIACGVGRIDWPGKMPFAGTGFLVADDIVMTNRHVVTIFAREQDGRWSLKPGDVTIDFKKELNDPSTVTLKVVEVLLVLSPGEPDLALLRVDRTTNPGEPAPAKLQLASTPPAMLTNKDVFVMGYPARDADTPATVQFEIFEGIYDVKRLQPGKLTEVDEQALRMGHDCSTLGGNSGSCVVDLDRGQVLGVHVAGTYRVGNRAVPLWPLRAHSKLEPFGLNWVD